MNVDANGAELAELAASGVLADSPATRVLELPTAISAAGLSQVLRQCRAEHGRVALVVPPAADGQAYGNTVLWQVAQRQAESQGLTVAVVTRTGRIRTAAADAGLPVFGSIQGAQTPHWEPNVSRLEYTPPAPLRDTHRPASEQRRGRLTSRFRRVKLSEGDRPTASPIVETLVLIVTLIACLGIVSAVVAFVVPGASVTLAPAQEPVTARVAVTARPDVEEATIEENGIVIPARRIGQRVEAEGALQATGARSAPDLPAEGAVVFTNKRSSPVEIPVGTVVATATGSNVRFETVQPAELPGGIGARVTAPVRALEPGPAGNVRAFGINTIEGPLAVSANVINPQGTYGGSVKQVAVVTQGDKDRLRAQLEQQVAQKAYAALGDLLEEGEFAPPETVATIVVDETYDRFTDEAADEVTLRLRLLATALAVDGKAADELAFQALGQKLPRRGRLLADSVTYNNGAAVVSQDCGGDSQCVDPIPVIEFDITASGVAVLDIDPAAVRAAIQGRRPSEAVAELQRRWRLQSQPELSLGPDWLLPILRRLDFPWLPLPVADRVPWLPFRTHVTIRFVE